MSLFNNDKIKFIYLITILFMGHLALAEYPDAQRNAPRAISAPEAAAAQVPAREVREEHDEEFVEVSHDDFAATFGDLSSFSPAVQARISADQVDAASFFDRSMASILSKERKTSISIVAGVLGGVLVSRWHPSHTREIVVGFLSGLGIASLALLNTQGAMHEIASLRDTFLKAVFAADRNAATIDRQAEQNAALREHIAEMSAEGPVFVVARPRG